jgi:phosphoserine aminotransferase
MSNNLEKPNNPRFGSGPTRKVASWSLESIKTESLGVSHRNEIGLARIRHFTTTLRSVLAIPTTHHIAILNGGGTGAIEFLLWNLLGSNAVDVFVAGIFGELWYFDIKHELKLKHVRRIASDVGQSPNFHEYDNGHDCVFVFSETTAGTTVPNTDWIRRDRAGLTICDATSAVGCVDIPWDKLDAVSFSFQKWLGGEGGLGVIAINNRGVNRCNSNSIAAKHPIPRLFRLPRVPSSGDVDMGFFKGYTINTVSLLTIEDALIALRWASQVGGLSALIQRIEKNFEIIEKWVSQQDWINFFVEDKKSRNKSSVCLTVKNHDNWPFLRKMSDFLQQHKVAFDILNHTQSKPALRIWAGPAVDSDEIRKLLPWLKEAYQYALT